MKLGQVSLTGGEVSPSLYARVDLGRFKTGAKMLRNWVVQRFGGIQNRAGFEFSGMQRYNTRAGVLIPFEFNTEQTYMLLFEDQNMRVIRDGELARETQQSITSITQANPGVVTKTSHGYSDGDTIVHTGSDMTQINNRYLKVANSTANTYELQDEDGNALDTTSYTAFTTGNAARVYEISTPWLAADLDQLYGYTQNADVMTICHRDYATRDLTRTGHTAWTLSTYSRSPDIQPPTGVAGSGSGSIDYVVTSINDATGEESVASAASTGDSTGSVSWTAPGSGPTPDRYAVYARDNGGVYGFIGLSESTSFNNTGITPDYTFTPAFSRDPFSTSGEYPASTVYFEQRQMFGQTGDEPDTLFASASGLRNNHNQSRPLQASDAFEFTLASEQVNEIRHLVASEDLLVLTSGAEWRVGGTEGNVLSPSSIDAKPQTYHGCSYVRPAKIGNDILYVQDGGETIRSLTFTLELDGYDGDEISVLAEHLFAANPITSMAWSEEPLRVLWCTLTDGRMAGCTFDKKQEIIGWHQHVTNRGKFGRVATVKEGGYDATYVTVKRIINGNARWYVERLADRRTANLNVRKGLFLDSGLSNDVSVALESISVTAGVATFTATSHGFVDSQVIGVDEIEWLVDTGSTDEDPTAGLPPVNGKQFLVTNAAANTFELQDLDGNALDASGWADYADGGELRAVISEVGGLWHLEGETVGVLNDGNVEAEKTVTNGTITLANNGSLVHVGSPIRGADFRVLPLTSRDVAAEMQTAEHLIPNVFTRVRDTRGLSVGTSQNDLTEFTTRNAEDWDEPTRLYTGDLDGAVAGEWQRFTNLLFRQTHPLPATILAVIPDVVVGE